jgi:hypothetical protein
MSARSTSHKTLPYSILAHTSLLSTLLCLTLLSPSPLRAQPPDTIVTDRPDVAESSLTVGTLRLQIESGADVGWADDGTATVGLPTKLRFGLTPGTELHLEGDIFRATSQRFGAADLDVGGKVHFVDGDGAIPSTGLLLAWTLPLDSESLATYALSPTLAFDWGLGAGFSLAINTGVTVPLAERERADDVFRWAVALGWTVPALDERLGIYLEGFGESPFTGGGHRVAADGGFTFLVTPLVQLDLYVRAGISEAADPFGAGAGVSVKF